MKGGVPARYRPGARSRAGPNALRYDDATQAEFGDGRETEVSGQAHHTLFTTGFEEAVAGEEAAQAKYEQEQRDARAALLRDDAVIDGAVVTASAKRAREMARAEQKAMEKGKARAAKAKARHYDDGGNKFQMDPQEKEDRLNGVGVGAKNPDVRIPVAGPQWQWDMFRRFKFPHDDPSIMLPVPPPEEHNWHIDAAFPEAKAKGLKIGGEAHLALLRKREKEAWDEVLRCPASVPYAEHLKNPDAPKPCQDCGAVLKPPFKRCGDPFVDPGRSPCGRFALDADLVESDGCRGALCEACAKKGACAMCKRWRCRSGCRNVVICQARAKDGNGGVCGKQVCWESCAGQCSWSTCRNPICSECDEAVTPTWVAGGEHGKQPQGPFCAHCVAAFPPKDGGKWYPFYVTPCPKHEYEGVDPKGYQCPFCGDRCDPKSGLWPAKPQKTHWHRPNEPIVNEHDLFADPGHAQEMYEPGSAEEAWSNMWEKSWYPRDVEAYEKARAAQQARADASHPEDDAAWHAKHDYLSPAQEKLLAEMKAEAEARARGDLYDPVAVAAAGGLDVAPGAVPPPAHLCVECGDTLPPELAGGKVAGAWGRCDDAELLPLTASGTIADLNVVQEDVPDDDGDEELQ